MPRIAKNIPEPPTPLAVARRVEALGRDLTSAQAQGLSDYLDLLAKWSRSVNLVGHQDWREVLADLVADSWHLADFLHGLGSALPPDPLALDLGAGAGLPGIPLRLFWTPGDYHLVEVRAKRVAFLRMALARLGLPRTHVAEGRVQDVAPGLGPAGLVLSRAFMPWPELLALAAGLAGPDGACVVMASQPPPENLPHEVAANWAPAGAAGYDAPGGQRWLWAFTRRRACPRPAFPGTSP